jgi:hypothetical protein
VATAAGGGDLDLEVDVQSGRWALVVMNADAAPGVIADVRLGATLPALGVLSAVLLSAGAVVLIGGTVLLVVAAASTRPGPPSNPDIPAPREAMAVRAPGGAARHGR